MTTYSAMITALGLTGIPFREGAWKDADKLLTDYGVYAIDGRDDLIADGSHAEKILEGTVDLFTRGSNGTAKAALVEAALDAAKVAWRVGLAADYESGTGLTHWEWIFNCLPDTVTVVYPATTER